MLKNTIPLTGILVCIQDSSFLVVAFRDPALPCGRRTDPAKAYRGNLVNSRGVAASGPVTAKFPSKNRTATFNLILRKTVRATRITSAE